MADESEVKKKGLPKILYGRCCTPSTSRRTMSGNSWKCDGCRTLCNDYKIRVDMSENGYFLNGPGVCDDYESLTSAKTVSMLLRMDVWFLQMNKNLDEQYLLLVL